MTCKTPENPGKRSAAAILSILLLCSCLLAGCSKNEQILTTENFFEKEFEVKDGCIFLRQFSRHTPFMEVLKEIDLTKDTTRQLEFDTKTVKVPLAAKAPFTKITKQYVFVCDRLWCFSYLINFEMEDSEEVMEALKKSAAAFFPDAYNDHSAQYRDTSGSTLQIRFSDFHGYDGVGRIAIWYNPANSMIYEEPFWDRPRT